MIFKQKTANLLLVFGLITLLIVGFTACDEDNFSDNPKYSLEFSTDSLTFDTVFNTIGSATSKILVYNRNKVALKISQIGLVGGSNSSFHVNVNGVNNANNIFTDMEISANDSMYIFISVTINSTSPLFIEDELIFTTNGNKQTINLQAFGQSMEILRNKYILNDTTLTADKPYLIFGYAAIDTTKTLTLKPGCKLYFHNNANLIVYGNLNAQGTAENPILMRGDRMDKIKFDTPFPYNNVAGQWGGVFLLWNGGKHILKNVTMNSGYVGVYFSNDDRETLPTLEITNCKIHNFLLYGLVVQNGNVTVANTEISNSSSYTVYLNGGKHKFIHSTIANHFNDSKVQPVTRDKNPAVMIMNINRIAPMETEFLNCIITGSSENEFSIATRFPELYKGKFHNCYIRKPKASDLTQFVGTRWFQKNDTIFKSERYDYIKNTYFNFALDSVSPARKIGDPTIAAELPLDLNGNSRILTNQPDAGAYQWQPTK